MKSGKFLIAILVCLLWTVPVVRPVAGADMRAISKNAETDLRRTVSESETRKQVILKTRKQLKAAIADSQKRIESLESDISKMDAEYARLGKKRGKLAEALERLETDINGYAGVVRQSADDLFPVISGSVFSAGNPERTEVLGVLRDPDRFPGISEVKELSGLVFDEMVNTGQVKTFQGSFLGRDGRTREGGILTVGPFSAAYSTADETGFLRYSEARQSFAALSSLPCFGMQRNLEKYITGESGAVYFDPSGGSALKRISHRSTLKDKVKKGGLLVWPILGIGVLAIVIVLERLVFLQRVHANADRLMGKFNKLAAEGDWTGCRHILETRKGRPVYNVLKAGFSAVDQSRETLDNILQEAILKELPRLERFLPALNVMAAVSPLIGLLGTVTGMIGTFHVITLYGTGDPRLMSGGISEALVTTMLGLGVAIPVMLFHAFLRRRIEHIVGDMEEKAVALSNIICRQNSNGGTGAGTRTGKV
ncbi:MAG: MotA/TolQ/ExbB proton channel family protein [Desulfobacteraceae bacterium]